MNDSSDPPADARALDTLAASGGDASRAATDAAWRAAAQAAIVTTATDLGLIEFDGPDRAAFLQGQLSNDVAALTPGQGHWTTYNSPKGRMLATMFLMQHPSGASHAALLARDLVQSTAKRLAMFVLRAKVTIRASMDAPPLLGVGGPGAAQAVDAALAAAPPPGSVAVAGDARIAAWPDGRFVVIGTDAQLGALRAALMRHATPAGERVWAWLGVRAGVPMITAATQDQFVAQTANWDALGGIDFRKGCYTGQEIVARMQYLGRLKERLFAFRASIDAPPPGTRLFSAAFGDQASGTVVNSAPDPDGGSRFLAVCQIEAADAGTMAVASPDGAAARRESLPYELPAPAAPRGRLAR